MNSNRFNLVVAALSVLIALTSFLFIWAVTQENKVVTSLSLGIIWILEIIALIRYVNMTNKNLQMFLQSFQFGDNSLTFNRNKKLPFKSIYDEFNRIIDQFDRLKAEKEIEHQYFEHIIKHADTGLIAWDAKESVQLFNRAARELLNMPHITTLQSLSKVMPELPDLLREMKPGKQQLIRVLRGDELVSLYLRISEFTTGGEVIRLVALQNIHPEIEESEASAWQKLIKVLTHEIVNSVGPIRLVSSALLKKIAPLADGNENNDKHVQPEHRRELSPAELDELYSGLQAIHNRSIGLSKFVDDYKSITELPKLEFKEVLISDMMGEILMLMKQDIIGEDVQIKSLVDPPELKVYMDKKMIGQVFINLIKNAVQSMEGKEDPKIVISSESRQGHTLLSIEDNGCGIPFSMLDYIFMPFFTTKKDGSGIGLTLARRIMKLHNGLIHVVSKEGEGTKVTLEF